MSDCNELNSLLSRLTNELTKQGIDLKKLQRDILELQGFKVDEEKIVNKSVAKAEGVLGARIDKVAADVGVVGAGLVAVRRGAGGANG